MGLALNDAGRAAGDFSEFSKVPSATIFPLSMNYIVDPIVGMRKTPFPVVNVNLLTPNVNYSGRTSPLTSKVAFYIFIQLCVLLQLSCVYCCSCLVCIVVSCLVCIVAVVLCVLLLVANAESE